MGWGTRALGRVSRKPVSFVSFGAARALGWGISRRGLINGATPATSEYGSLVRLVERTKFRASPSGWDPYGPLPRGTLRTRTQPDSKSPMGSSLTSPSPMPRTLGEISTPVGEVKAAKSDVATISRQPILRGIVCICPKPEKKQDWAGRNTKSDLGTFGVQQPLKGQPAPVSTRRANENSPTRSPAQQENKLLAVAR